MKYLLLAGKPSLWTSLQNCSMTSQGLTPCLSLWTNFRNEQLFIATKKNLTAPEAALSLQEHVFFKHDMPRMFICDRDPKFRSNFWARFPKLLKVKLNMSTANQPKRTDRAKEWYAHYQICFDTRSRRIRMIGKTCWRFWNSSTIPKKPGEQG